MKNISAGLFMYRWKQDKLEVLLCHPGGPLYEGKDNGYWGIPKGKVEANETILQGAFREFAEETGFEPCISELISLGSVTEKSGKLICAWAFQGNCDTDQPVQSNLFQMEWPPRSGRIQSFPEVDQLQFVTPDMARIKIECIQRQFVERLEKHLHLGYQIKEAL